MNRKNLLIVALLSEILVGLHFPAQAEDYDYRWSAGINLPGLGLKYFPWKHTAIELKLQGEQDVFVLEPRINHYVLYASGVRAFVGAAGDIITFTGEDSQGQGWGGEVFVGGEYFFLLPFSLQIDIGPAWIYVRDQATGIVAGGSPEWVLNIGLNWYFGKE